MGRFQDLAKRFENGPSFEITRSLFLRSLGFIYLVAYISLNRQVIPLLGTHGLLPADLFLKYVQRNVGGSAFDAFLRLPSVFWIRCDDPWLSAGSILGITLSLVMIAGATNAVLMICQWFLYMSFVHIGQVFYGYGWETMTLEAGFLAIFLCPVRGIRPFPATFPAPRVVIWFYRWMLFRVMFGAGLIKIRGDECWRDLTCLAYHYETQPLPGPFSWYFHNMPLWFHEAGVLFNHFIELVVPWFYFAPRRIRHAAGVLTIFFQTILIVSGNLSFLNWLTIVIAIPCFDDRALGWIRRKVFRIAEPLREKPDPARMPAVQRWVLICLSATVILLSFYPVRNMLSPRQLMNASFDRLHLVNTYGAFGSVGKVRDEIILEGTYDNLPDESAHWMPYEFLAKPGDPYRRPPWIAPYQSRIDWQIWFAAMEDYSRNPWLVHLIYKLLNNDPGALSLLKASPFTRGPPRFIRADLYEYHFTKSHSAGTWWTRERKATYLPPLSRNDLSLQRYLHSFGWED